MCGCEYVQCAARDVCVIGERVGCESVQCVAEGKCV